MEKILNIHIKNNKPVDINNLARSLNGLASLYRSFIESHDYNADIEPKLYVKEIKEGSIDIYLLGQLLNTLEFVNPTLEFANNLYDMIEILKGSKEDNGKKISKKDCEALIDFTDVTARDINAEIGISVKDNNGIILNNCNQVIINTIDANAAQNAAKKRIEEFTQQRPTSYQQVEMYWADANFLSDKAHGKIIIEAISDKAVGVKFLNDEDRKKCTSNNTNYPENPWQDLLYTVDIEAIYVQDKLRGYKITKVYEDVIPLS